MSLRSPGASLDLCRTVWHNTDISNHFHFPIIASLKKLPLNIYFIHCSREVEQETFICHFTRLAAMAGLCKSMILLLGTDHILFDYLCQIWPMLMVTAAGWVCVSSDQPWLRSTLPWENGAFQFLSSLSWIWAFKIFLMLSVDMDTVDSCNGGTVVSPSPSPPPVHCGNVWRQTRIFNKGTMDSAF